MKAIDVIPIPALKDNYIWLLRSAGVSRCAIVDPGDAQPVLEYLLSANMRLCAILITHHHPDHTGGISALKQVFPDCPVYGPRNENIPLLEHDLAEGDPVHLPELELGFRVFDIPGHTPGHIAYYCADKNLLFCGDTLFSAGCGRLLGGTAEQLHTSLQRLAGLPGETDIYCGHEYTLKNIVFARQVEPDNIALQQWEHRVVQLRGAGVSSLPVRLANELSVNPFLRTHVAVVRKAAEDYCGESLPAAVDVFRVLRHWKDYS